MRLSTIQIDLLNVIIAGNNGAPVDVGQICERAAHKPSKQALLFSIRPLIAKGLIEKGEKVVRNGRACTTYIPTSLGRRILKAEVNPCFVEGEENHLSGLFND